MYMHDVTAVSPMERGEEGEIDGEREHFQEIQDVLES
jgi:hypothetical protein